MPGESVNHPGAHPNSAIYTYSKPYRIVEIICVGVYTLTLLIVILLMLPLRQYILLSLSETLYIMIQIIRDENDGNQQGNPLGKSRDN